MRPHVAAVYAFARLADDIADEPGPSGPPSACGCSTPGSAACAGDSSMPDPGELGADLQSSSRSRHTIRSCRLPPSALHGSAQRVPAGRDDVTRYRNVGRTCSTTAGARPIRSAGSCCASPGYDDAALDAAVGRRLHGAAADELLAGPRDRLARRGGCTCRSTIGTAPAPRKPISTRGRMTPEWRRRLATWPRGRRALFARRTAGMRRRARPAALGASRSPGSARTVILDKLEAAAVRRLRAAARRSTRGRRAAVALARDAMAASAGRARRPRRSARSEGLD